MVTYGLDILPLVRHIKSIILAPQQLWYVNNAAIMATWSLIVAYYFDEFIIYILRHSFFLEPEKSILMVKEGYEEAAACFFSGSQFEIVTGTRYLCRYVTSKDGGGGTLPATVSVHQSDALTASQMGFCSAGHRQYAQTILATGCDDIKGVPPVASG